MNQENAVSDPKPTYVERLVDEYAFSSQYQYQQDVEMDIEKAISESIIIENLRKSKEHQKKKEMFIRKLEDSCLRQKNERQQQQYINTPDVVIKDKTK